jgi:hypothetical protein
MENSPGAIIRLMSVKEVATLKEVQPNTVYRWVHLKKPLQVMREGRRIFISNVDLDRFIIARQPKSPMPIPDAGAGKTNRASAIEPRAAIPTALALSDLLQQPASCSGQRELGLRLDKGTPRIAMLIGLQLV